MQHIRILRRCPQESTKCKVLNLIKLTYPICSKLKGKEASKAIQDTIMSMKLQENRLIKISAPNSEKYTI